MRPCEKIRKIEPENGQIAWNFFASVKEMEKAKNLDEANEFFGETMEQIYSVLVESGLPDSR